VQIVTNETSQAIIKATEILGGKQNLAKDIGVSYKTILDWISGRSGITVTNALKVEKATGGKVKSRDILPDFPWDDLK
jgi:hypothetical protein